MSSPKDKPRGYFEYLLAMDCETTGLCVNSSNPITDGQIIHQPLSWGLIVANAKTLKPIEELYVEIKWNQNSVSQANKDPWFGKEAEKIHGLTREYLDKNGIDEEEAVLQIGEMILKHWGPEVSIRTLGHNVHTFDMPFFRDMFQRYGINLKFGNRHFDTNSIGFATVGSFNSDDLFDTVCAVERKQHNALEDARLALESTRIVRLLWNDCVGVNAYE